MGSCCSSPSSNFDIRDAVHEGEDGAGWLCKTGRNVPTVKRRFFVIKDCLITYYHEDNRENPKGVIKLGPRASATQLTGPESSRGGKVRARARVRRVSLS